ncbi:hypothetical protein ACMHYO_22210 [Allopusillimonas ginsengisoli]|uniref:hypothetical protein n=1 Tax=Allopusillimonas ginsengisoli TaxID=453575 RepID=UPI0039C16BAE
MLAPELHALIDWSVAPLFLDTELQSITADSPNGRRYADKLVKLRRLDQSEAWVLVHVEVESGPQGDKARSYLAQRMFTYFYRIWDRYVRQETGGAESAKVNTLDGLSTSFYSLAILTASSKGPPVVLYRQRLGKCHVSFGFPVVHLRRWEDDRASLVDLAAFNPFAVVVMAQLGAQACCGAQARLVSKIALLRLLYQHRYDRRRMQQLFRIVDWVLSLPHYLAPAFEQAVAAIEVEFNMPYVTSIERMGEARGLKKGLAEGLQRGHKEGRIAGREEGREEGRRDSAAWLLSSMLERRFGQLPVWVTVRITQANTEALHGWALKVLEADRLEVVFE